MVMANGIDEGEQAMFGKMFSYTHEPDRLLVAGEDLCKREQL